jgi:hypothetical protein
MSGDTLALIGVTAYLLFVAIGSFYVIYQLTARLVLRSKHRRTVRALLSVIREEADATAQIEQMKEYYERYVSDFKGWHGRRSPPRFPVYLQNVVYDLDHLQVEGFQKLYQVNVPPHARSTLRAVAERVQESQMEPPPRQDNDPEAGGTSNQPVRSTEAKVEEEAEEDRQ